MKDLWEQGIFPSACIPQLLQKFRWRLVHSRCLTTTVWLLLVKEMNDSLLNTWMSQPGTEWMVNNHEWIINTCMCQNPSQGDLWLAWLGATFSIFVFIFMVIFFFLLVNIDKLCNYKGTDSQSSLGLITPSKYQEPTVLMASLSSDCNFLQ